jgi:hypothetical protein
MAAAVVVAIVMLFVNGDLQNLMILGRTPDMATCQSTLPKAVEIARKDFAKDEQIVGKCVDLSQVPNAASAFGLADKV